MLIDRMDASKISVPVLTDRLDTSITVLIDKPDVLYCIVLIDRQDTCKTSLPVLINRPDASLMHYTD